jgi:hypothetical protein
MAVFGGLGMALSVVCGAKVLVMQANKKTRLALASTRFSPGQLL